jgi:putative endonuclease
MDLMSDRVGFVYILTNKNNHVLYVGVTTHLQKRIYEHKQKMVDGFSKRYNLTKLVFAEEHPSVMEAIRREKQIKGWLRRKKIDLIQSLNPEWKDLYDSLCAL